MEQVFSKIFCTNYLQQILLGQVIKKYLVAVGNVLRYEQE